MIEAVLFDCDGVLVDSERLNNEVFAELLTAAGVPTTFADCVDRYMGRSTAECVADVERRLGRAFDVDLVTEYERRVLDRQRVELVAVPGVRGLLDGLRTAGVPICVASSGSPDEIATRLAVTGLDRYFGERLYSAAMVRYGKPAPDLFLFAADKLGVDPGGCVVIEDSPYGVRAGKAAGMTVIGYAALASEATLRAAGADHVLRALGEAAPLLGIHPAPRTTTSAAPGGR